MFNALRNRAEFIVFDVCFFVKKKYLRTKLFLKEALVTLKVFKKSFNGQVNDLIQTDLNDMSIEVLSYEKGQKGYEVKRLSS